MSSGFDSGTQPATLPCCCIECAQAYTTAHFQQPLETYLSQNVSRSEKLERNNRIVPISTKDAGSSKSVARVPLNLPETKPLKIFRRNNYEDPTITSAPARPRNPRTVPTQDQSASTHVRDHLAPSQNPRKTGLSNSVSKPRKHNEDLPPIPTQRTSSSNRGSRQVQYPPETIEGSYSADKPHSDGPPSIPSARTEERNQYNYAQRRPLSQQPRVTRVSFSANKPRELDRVESPAVPMQEKSQSNYSQPQDSQASSNVNNVNQPQDRADHPKASIPTQDQSQDHNTDASKADTRPHLVHGTPSQLDTQYVNMLLALDDIPQLHNILAGFFNWILLAGFILFPGTFTSLKNLGGSGQAQQLLVHAVTSIPLFVIAWLCTGVGAIGMLWLWWRWRKNYIWALNKIFLPGALNSLAGFLSTMANVFGAQHGELSTTSKVTIIVTAASTGVLGILTAIYSFWVVKRVKSQHDRTVGKQRTGKYGEGVVDLSTRQADV